MDPATFTLAIKGIGMLALIIGGLLALFFGFNIFKRKSRAGDAEIAFEIGAFKATGKSVGSVVMATAGIWAWLGAGMAPNLKQSGGNVEIYSFDTFNGKVSAPAVSVALSPAAGSAAINDPDQLKALFAAAVRQLPPNAAAAKSFEVDGNRAVVDFTTVQTRSNPQEGGRDIATVISSSGDSATISYKPELIDGTIKFRPTGVIEYVATKEPDPNRIIG